MFIASKKSVPHCMDTGTTGTPVRGEAAAARLLMLPFILIYQASLPRSICIPEQRVAFDDLFAPRLFLVLGVEVRGGRAY